MVCPSCSRHKLLRADGKWFCPQCFQVYHALPLYGYPNKRVRQMQ